MRIEAHRDGNTSRSNRFRLALDPRRDWPVFNFVPTSLWNDVVFRAATNLVGDIEWRQRPICGKGRCQKARHFMEMTSSRPGGESFIAAPADPEQSSRRIRNDARICRLFRAIEPNGYIHPVQRVGASCKTAGYGHRLANVTRNGNRYQIESADTSVGWIKYDPPRTRHVDLRPRMGRSRAFGAHGVLIRMVQAPRHDACPETKAACRIHEEDREVAAQPPILTKRLGGCLGAFFFAVFVDDPCRDAGAHILQKRQRIHRRFGDEPVRPTPQMST